MKKILAVIFSISLCWLSLDAATVAYYEFNGSGTATIGATITDATGNHNGSVEGGDLVYGSDPFAGGYLSFAADANGANTGNRVVIPGAADLIFTTDTTYTFEIIFRTTQTAVGVLLSKGSDSGNPDSQWWLRHNGAGRVQGLVEGVDNATEDSVTSSAATAIVSDGKWHHVALVFNGTNSPRRLDVFVDGTLGGSDTGIGTLGLIGGVDADPVIVGEYASLAANRSFAGDLAAVRFSNTPLTPSEFLPLGLTYLSNIVPTNNGSFLPASTVASFVVNSPTIGVAETNIHVALNGSDITSQLAFAGTDAQRTVTLPALTANQVYRMDISVTDYASNLVTRTVNFNTFVNNLLFIEGEDYNFESGQFIDNPVLSSTPGPNNYLDRLGVEGIDYHQTNTPAAALYRIGDQVGTALSTDFLRQTYLDAQVTDPGVADYMARDHANSEWLNYTHTFPAYTYRVYARLAKSGTVPIVMRLDEVTSGSTTTSQTTAPIGFFRRLPTATASDFDFVALTDALGNEVAVPLSGVKTLRLTMVSGTAGANLNYLLFVPPGGVQRPFLASVAPAAGADNEAANASIQATIRNGDTTVSTGTIQLKLDGTNVPASVTPTSEGATVSYSPSAMSTSLHTATLTFDDSSAASVTNDWVFRVANLAVRGHWNFNEQTAGNSASTNAGAIQDASGNARHGTASAAGQAYVSGSFNYGNTPALRFTAGADRVVVPDPAGSFSFSGSFTLEAVIRTTNTATSAAILAKNGSGDGEGEYWWRAPGATGGKQRVAMNGYFIAGTNTLNDGSWHHLAVVFDQAAAQIRLYADYALEAVTNSINFDKPVGRPADLQIGGFIASTASEFNGDIDFIRISDGALSTAEFVQASVALEPVVKNLRPADGARNVAPWTRIEAEVQNRDTAVVLGSLRLFVDGNDVTASSTKTSEANGAKISYAPGAALANGLHAAMTTFNDTAVPANSWTNSWSFTVAGSVPVLALYQLNEKAPGNEADPTPDAILDVSGGGHHLTAAGSPLPQYTAGAPNYGNSSAMAFTAGDDNLNTANTAGLDFGVNDSFTLEAVVRTVADASFTGNIIGRDWGANLPSWWFRIEAGPPRFLVAQTGGPEPNVTADRSVNDGNWHHVAAVRDALTRKLRVYVDYTLAGEATDTTTLPLTNAQNLVVGAYNSGTRQFEGEMDVVRISGEALDPSWFIPLGGLASPFMLVNHALVGNNLSFSFATETGRTYVVESTDALGTGWSNVETVIGDGTVKTVSYPATDTKRFYRVRAQ